MNRKLILALCTIFTASTLISTYSVNTYADTPSTYETTENSASSSETAETSETIETTETAEQPDNADTTFSNTAKTITPEDASSTGTIPSIENIPAFSVSNEKIADFVTRLYHIILNREPDETGFYDWYTGLENQSKTGADLIFGFIFSPEFQEKNTSDEEFVSTLYHTILGREPDGEGKASWLKVLNEGFSRRFICDEFIRSQEFIKSCSDIGIVSGQLTLVDLLDINPKTTRFVNRLYKLILSRDADDSGRRAWVSNLVSKKETAAITVYGFIHSNEFQGKNLSDGDYVDILYATLLDRTADSKGHTDWVNVLQSNHTRDYVLKGFIDSAEFTQICADYGVERGTIENNERVYQNPSQYYQIQDSIKPLSGGGYELSSGYEGLKVAYVIKRLGVNHGKYTGMATPARYGPQTRQSVIAFQKAHGLKADGIVGLKTWKALGFSESDWYNLGTYISPIRVNKNSTRSDCIEAMIGRAYDYLGTPYVVGASGRPGQGVDCSGLVMQALYAAGLDLSPINPVRHSHPGYEFESANMYASSKFKHVSYENRQRGDLIFYKSATTGKIIHVAIYLGNNQVIESWCEPHNKVIVGPMITDFHQYVAGVVRPFV